MAGGDAVDPVAPSGGPDAVEFVRGVPVPTSNGHCGRMCLLPGNGIILRSFVLAVSRGVDRRCPRPKLQMSRIPWSCEHTVVVAVSTVVHQPDN